MMLTRRLICLMTIFLMMTNSIDSQTLNVSSGKVIRWSNFSSKYVVARNIDVWLPEDYNSNTHYAVLYMQDGQMLFDSAITWNHQEWMVDETISALIKQQKIKNCIVVGIWHDDKLRHSEYFPQKPFEILNEQQRKTLMTSTRSTGFNVFNDTIRSDNYLKFIVEELKPFIDDKYATLKDKSNTFIAGSSMGGLISMYAVCEYPNVFGGAGCLSTHWPGIFTLENNPIPDAFISYMRTHLPSPKDHLFYFDYGTATLDSLYPGIQGRVDAVMKEKGYTSRNWITKAFPGEDHSEKSWSKRLNYPLEFLLRK